jgi:hypothetical protein
MFGFLILVTWAWVAEGATARSRREKKDFAGAIALLEPMSKALPVGM